MYTVHRVNSDVYKDRCEMSYIRSSGVGQGSAGVFIRSQRGNEGPSSHWLARPDGIQRPSELFWKQLTQPLGHSVSTSPQCEPVHLYKKWDRKRVRSIILLLVTSLWEVKVGGGARLIIFTCMCVTDLCTCACVLGSNLSRQPTCIVFVCTTPAPTKLEGFGSTPSSSAVPNPIIYSKHTHKQWKMSPRIEQ